MKFGIPFYRWERRSRVGTDVGSYKKVVNGGSLALRGRESEFPPTIVISFRFSVKKSIDDIGIFLEKA